MCVCVYGRGGEGRAGQGRRGMGCRTLSLGSTVGGVTVMLDGEMRETNSAQRTVLEFASHGNIILRRIVRWHPTPARGGSVSTVQHWLWHLKPVEACASRRMVRHRGNFITASVWNHQRLGRGPQIMNGWLFAAGVGGAHLPLFFPFAQCRPMGNACISHRL